MKLYVIVRNDLTPAQKAVQAGHAATDWIIDNAPQVAKWNKTLVYLTAKDMHNLLHIKQRLDYKDIKYTAFYEPDIGNEITAIACLGSNSTVKRLRLLQ